MGGDSGQRSPQGSDSCGSVGPRRRRDLPSSAVAVLKDWLLSADQSVEPLSEEVRAESGVARGVDDWNCVFFSGCARARFRSLSRWRCRECGLSAESLATLTVALLTRGACRCGVAWCCVCACDGA